MTLYQRSVLLLSLIGLLLVHAASAIISYQDCSVYGICQATTSTTAAAVNNSVANVNSSTFWGPYSYLTYGIFLYNQTSATPLYWNLSSTNLFPQSLSYNVGIGTSTPNGKLNVVGTTNLTGNITFGNHLISLGSSPTITSCGTSPSINGTDTKGVAVVGSGLTTSCEIDFATKYSKNPVCVVTDSSGSISAGITLLNTTTMITGFSAALGGGELYYICVE